MDTSVRVTQWPAAHCGGHQPPCSALPSPAHRAAPAGQGKKWLCQPEAPRGHSAGRKGLTHAGVDENKSLQINSVLTVSSSEWAPVSCAGCLLLPVLLMVFHLQRLILLLSNCPRQLCHAIQTHSQVHPQLKASGGSSSGVATLSRCEQPPDPWGSAQT